MRLIIVSGLAGSGKSGALNMLEDLGYYCIDNLPLSLLHEVTADTLRAQGEHYERMAVGVDARAGSRDISAFPAHIDSLRKDGVDVQVIFLEADADVILNRYRETRRKHPLTDGRTPLTEAIAADRALLKPIAEQADLRLDTSQTNIHQLRELIRTRVEANSEGGLSILLQSFGFKHGVPDAADFLFDVRCLSNPHWVAELRKHTGREAPVIDYLDGQPDVQKMFADIGGFLDDWLPAFERENRAYITIAIGCTGGQHRSVYLVEKLAERLRGRFHNTMVRHSELP